MSSWPGLAAIRLWWVIRCNGGAGGRAAGPNSILALTAASKGSHHGMRRDDRVAASGRCGVLGDSMGLRYGLLQAPISFSRGGHTKKSLS